MSNRLNTGSLQERLNTLISTARITCKYPNSAREIRHVMMGPSFKRDWQGDKQLSDHLLGYALGQKIDTYLKHQRNGDEGGGLTEAQLDLWPDAQRSLIKDIDRARVFVPSRMEYVPVTPECLSAADAKEAGSHLIKHGEDSIRVGQMLLQLAESMWGVS